MYIKYLLSYLDLWFLDPEFCSFPKVCPESILLKFIHKMLFPSFPPFFFLFSFLFAFVIFFLYCDVKYIWTLSLIAITELLK